MRVNVVIEHMDVAARPAADGLNCLAGTVTSSTYLGSATKISLTTRSGTPLSLTLPTDRAAETLRGGPQLWITWPKDRGFLLPEDLTLCAKHLFAGFRRSACLALAPSQCSACLPRSGARQTTVLQPSTHIGSTSISFVPYLVCPAAMGVSPSSTEYS